MSNKFSDAEVYLAIKSAFVALRELSKKSLRRRALSGHYPQFKNYVYIILTMFYI